METSSSSCRQPQPYNTDGQTTGCFRFCTKIDLFMCLWLLFSFNYINTATCQVIQCNAIEEMRVFSPTMWNLFENVPYYLILNGLNHISFRNNTAQWHYHYINLAARGTENIMGRCQWAAYRTQRLSSTIIEVIVNGFTPKGSEAFPFPGMVTLRCIPIHELGSFIIKN